MATPSTLKPAEVAVAMVQSGVAKHRDRYENVFFKAVSLANSFLVLIMKEGQTNDANRCSRVSCCPSEASCRKSYLVARPV